MADDLATSVFEILAHWLPDASERVVQPLGNHGGLSGARLWKVICEREPLCLRRWPRTVRVVQLEKIHRLLSHLAASHDTIPAPLATLADKQFVQLDNAWWELAPWLPGEAVAPEDYTPQHYEAAFGQLAALHISAASLPTQWDTEPELSPGLKLRLQECQEFDRFFWPSVPKSMAIIRVCDLLRKHRHQIQTELQEVAAIRLPLQWRIGDIHSQHVLFSRDDVTRDQVTGVQVTGIVDFGGVCIDSPAADVARLLGSLAGGDVAKWRLALAAFERVRPLSKQERRAAVSFHYGGLVVAVLRWVEWASEEEPQNGPGIAVKRLAYLADQLAVLETTSISELVRAICEL